MDNCSLTYSMVAFGEALGSQVEYFEEHAPIIRRYVLEDIENIDLLDFSKASPLQDPYVQKLWQASQRIDLPLAVTLDLVGPLTALSSLIEAEKIMRAMRRKPAAVHALLEEITESLLEIVDVFAQDPSLHFSITDPMASGDLISPKQFEAFALPYLTWLVDRMKQHQRPQYIHICGNTRPLWSLLADTGIDAISLDQKVALQEAKEAVGDRVILIGNIDPVAVIRDGNPQEIKAAITQAYQAAGDSPKGFILAPGCSVPYDTPLENCLAFMQSGRGE